MHREAFNWVEKKVAHLDFKGCLVVELGSYNVNGTIRPLFSDADIYIGVDVRPGPDVDVVADAATFSLHDEKADFVVSCEMLEHAPRPEKVIRNIYKLLRPGGAFILTAAGVERAPHGNDGGEQGDEYYLGIDSGDLYDWCSKAGFRRFEIDTNPKAGDIYVFGYK